MRDGILTEADTCGDGVAPKLVEAREGTAACTIGTRCSFTNSCTTVVKGKVRCGRHLIGGDVGQGAEVLA